MVLSLLPEQAAVISLLTAGGREDTKVTFGDLAVAERHAATASAGRIGLNPAVVGPKSNYSQEKF